jgi:dTDP-4-amino-4,6-dideoxygalactose transaminase
MVTSVLDERIVLFHPHVPSSATQRVAATLDTRWIGQGPQVGVFEKGFSARFAGGRPCVAVGSGTDALHLAYVLANIGEGDEVITPVFTCTATNIPLLYQRAVPKFADIQPDTLNLDPQHVRSLLSERTKAIVCVHYGGLPCDMRELKELASSAGVPVIEDAAHAVGASYQGKLVGQLSEFTVFSFQAIKHITTGDGGMLVLDDDGLRSKADRIRWFGIDRVAKQKGIWENDIREIGYKYQMTDISATLGLAALEEYDATFAFRRRLFERYEKGLSEITGLRFIGGGYTDRMHAAWMCTVAVERRVDLQRKLDQYGIESDQVHYRNDRYSIFGHRRANLPNMDAIEDKYLVLPLHTKMCPDDVDRICYVVRSGW